jgi:hypothetical protein
LRHPRTEEQRAGIARASGEGHETAATPHFAAFFRLTPTGGLLRPRSARRLSDVLRLRAAQANERRPTVPIGATLSRVTRGRTKTRLQAVRTGVGEEYAISGAANPAADQSAHRRLAHPNRRRRVSAALEGVFCHAAKRERRGEWSSAACTRTDRVQKLADSSSQIAMRVLLRNRWWLAETTG